MERKRLGKYERKKQIKEIAIKLIIEKGFKNTSIKEIVKIMNYSAGGFYNCYLSKNDLFKDIIEDGIKCKREAILKYKEEYKNLSRREFVLETVLNEIFEKNNYKRMILLLFVEMLTDDSLKEVYNSLFKNSKANLIEFCEKEDLYEFIVLVDENFVNLMRSFMFGVELLHKNDDEHYRAIVRTLIEAYFDTIDLF